MTKKINTNQKNKQEGISGIANNNRKFIKDGVSEVAKANKTNNEKTTGDKKSK
jgi:hypothetical protein